MALVFYDKRNRPHGPNRRDSAFVSFTILDDGRHKGYLSPDAMRALGTPRAILLGFDDDQLLVEIHAATDDDPRALLVSQTNANSDSGQFAAGGFLRTFRLDEELIDRSLPLRRVNGHLAVKLMEVEVLETTNQKETPCL